MKLAKFRLWPLLAVYIFATVELLSAASGLYGSWGNVAGVVSFPSGPAVRTRVFSALTSRQQSGFLEVHELPGTSLIEATTPPIRFSGVTGAEGFLSAQGEGKGFEIVVPALDTAQVLRLWMGASGGIGLIEASMSGSGAHYYADTSFNSPASMQARVYTFNFAASSKNEKLRVSVKSMTQSGTAPPAVGLFGVALFSAADNRPPAVRIITPVPYASFAAPAQIQVQAEASDSDGSIAKVELYDFSLAIKLGEVSTAPYRFIISRTAAWSGSFCARAYDNLGRYTDSKPVRYRVVEPAPANIKLTEPLMRSFPSRGLPNAGFEGVSSTAELPNGDIYAVWYGGKYELSPDSAIYSAVLHKGASEWTVPRAIIDEPNVAEGNAVLLWRNGVLWCFYVKCFGPAWEFSRLFYRQSKDLGATWGKETPIHQPEFAYPTGTLVSTRPLLLKNGNILLPLNRESYDPERRKQWYSLFLISADGGKTWRETDPLYSNPGNIQPTVVQLADDSLFALFRVRGMGNCLWRSRSSDGGRTWLPLEQTDIPNPSARVGLGLLPSGQMVLAYNDSKTRRTPLNIALSSDGGKTWNSKAIESGGYAYTYPFLLVGSTGEVHVTYNDNYHAIKHALVDEKWFATQAAGMRVLRFSEGKQFRMGQVTSMRIVHPDLGARRLTLNYSLSETGSEFAQHVHDGSDDTILVLEGAADLRQGGSRRPMPAGTSAFVPAGQIHGTITTAPQTTMISFQTPPDLALYTGVRDSSKPGAPLPKGVITPGAVEYQPFDNGGKPFVEPSMGALRASASYRKLAAGESFSTDTGVASEHFLYVWKGEVSINRSGEQVRASLKDTVFINEPGAIRVRNEQSTEAIVIEVQSPPKAATALNGSWVMQPEIGGGKAVYWLGLKDAGTAAVRGSLYGATGGRLAPLLDVSLDEAGVLSARVERLFDEGPGPPRLSRAWLRAYVQDGRLHGMLNREDSGFSFSGWRSLDLARIGNNSSSVGQRVSLLSAGLGLEHWVKLSDGEEWRVANGAIQSSGKAVDLKSRDTFWNFELHAEYRMPQKMNSGISLRGRYELQLLGDYGEAPDAHGNGAIYSRIAPRVNASRPRNQWQVLDVTLRGRQVTVVLNGVNIIDKKEIAGPCGLSLDPFEDRPGPIVLQGSHGAVEFRNVYITPLTQ